MAPDAPTTGIGELGLNVNWATPAPIPLMI